MRHPIRSAVVAGASALLLATGAGTASAQGSLELALPFPLDIPGLASLMSGAAAPGATAVAAQDAPLVVVPPEVARKAFEGSVVAGVNEARTAVGAERLVTDGILSVEASVRADQLAAGDPTTGDLPVPESAEARDRTVLQLPAEATPQNVLTAMLTDTGMRERMLDGEFATVGVGTATDEDGQIHVVLDFER
ncbi:CAP domain-containing protein [Dietzia psychralcaliphila]|uniref:CAP domain-containing protein n=1 Tax=Dietzia psychralcaliphila TaxID=139021 RepID=UPI001C1DE806|nr:CAP domain-containing protein [Dietzia psychralcaliphila]